MLPRARARALQLGNQVFSLWSPLLFACAGFDGALLCIKYCVVASGAGVGGVRRVRMYPRFGSSVTSMTEGLQNRDLSAKVAVVTGAARGLGRAVVEELSARGLGRVYLTARDATAGARAHAQLQAKGLNPKFHQLDVTDPASVLRFAEHLRAECGGLDYLVNNAAVLDYDNTFPSYEAARRNVEVNYRSLLLLERLLLPALRDAGAVVNVSSACGHLSNLRNLDWIEKLSSPELTQETVDRFVEDYLASVRRGEFRRENFADDGKHAEHRVSKIALTALTMLWAKKYSKRHISVNALHPGHMATAMARGGGVVPPQYSAQLVAQLLLAGGGLSGAFMWHDRQLVDWRDHTAPLYYRHQDIKEYTTDR